MKQKVNLLILFLSIITISLKAQTVPLPSEAYLNLEVINSVTIPDEILDTLVNPMSLVAANDTLKISLSMLLEDTSSLHKIHIKLGTTLGGNDLLEQVFIFDDGNLTLPQIYFREAEMVTIGLGEYLNSGIFYCEIVLEDVEQNLSEIINCNSAQ